MQGKNFSQTKAPTPRDGTQTSQHREDANWYGPSSQPQEEFIEESPEPTHENHENMSEGKPTFTGSGTKPQNQS